MVVQFVRGDDAVWVYKMSQACGTICSVTNSGNPVLLSCDFFFFSRRRHGLERVQNSKRINGMGSAHWGSDALEPDIACERIRVQIPGLAQWVKDSVLPQAAV